jgi:uncharacterized delta-60 repeat protein
MEALEVRRLYAAGELDLSFGTNGVLTPQINNLDFNGIAPAGNNKFFVFQSGSFESSLQRIDANGATDPSFGTAGFAALHGIIPDHALVLPSGKIIVIDYQSGETAAFLERLNADGSHDTSFGTGGFVTFVTGFADGLTIPQIGVQSDGKIILWRFDQHTGVNTIARLNADGSSDGTFTTFEFDDDFLATVAAMAVLPDDRILLGGHLSDDMNSSTVDSHDYSFIRLTPDGTVDTTFATSYNDNSRVPRTPDGSVFNPNDLALVPGGNGSFIATGDDGATMKFNADGSIDTSFHSAGNTRAVIKNFTGVGGGRILAQSDGKFILYTEFSMARLNADGTLDQSFGRIYESDDLNTLSFQGGAALTASGDILAYATGVGPFQDLVRIQGSGTNDPRIALNGSTLNVNGTEDNDAISFPTALEVPGSFDPTETHPVGDDIAVLFVGGLEKLVDRAGVTLLNVAGRGGNDVINLFTETISATVSGGNGVDTIFGGDGDDSLSGNAGNDKIWGGGGNDRVAGNGGRDDLDGGDGDDRLYGGAGSDWLSSRAGRDILAGQNGDDSIFDNTGAATISGGAGDDRIVAFNGIAQNVFGDSGDDTAEVDASDVLAGIENPTVH